MKLSKAILKGSKIRPQSYYANFDEGCSCAQGAAAEAMGVEYGDNVGAELTLLCNFPWALTPVALPCGCAGMKPPLGSFGAIAHLNDICGGHKWTRERIADWVATIEPQEDAS